MSNTSTGRSSKGSKKAKKTFKIRPFPNAIYNCGMACEVDDWFAKVWQRKGALNGPSPNDFHFEARILSRSTLRQAWLVAQRASSLRTKQPEYAAMKRLRSRSDLLSKQLDQYKLLIRTYVGLLPVKRRVSSEGSSSLEPDITANEIEICLEGVTLGNEGAACRFDSGVSDGFATSIRGVSNLLQAMSDTTSEEISLYSSTIKNIGEPERRAFARPFVEAYVYMTGHRPDEKSQLLNKALSSAWKLLTGREVQSWRSQIVSSTKLFLEQDIQFYSTFGPPWLPQMASMIQSKNLPQTPL